MRRLFCRLSVYILGHTRFWKLGWHESADPSGSYFYVQEAPLSDDTRVVGAGCSDLTLKVRFHSGFRKPDFGALSPLRPLLLIAALFSLYALRQEHY